MPQRSSLSDSAMEEALIKLPTMLRNAVIKLVSDSNLIKDRIRVFCYLFI